MRAPISPVRRRQAIALLLIAAATGATADALIGGAADAQEPAPPVTVQAQTGPAWGGAELIGSSPQGATGDPAEAWAYRRAGAAVAPAAGLRYGPGTDPQVVLLRYTAAEGWRHVETPVDEQGAPYRGGSAQPEGARVTPRGGLIMLTTDSERPAAQHRLLMVRDRGQQLRVAPAPGPEVLLPAGTEPAERLSLSVAAAGDLGDRTGAWVAAEGRELLGGIAHWDGDGWTREPVCAGAAPPTGCDAGETLAVGALTGVALAAAGERAWLLARADGRGLVLFERTGGGDSVRWALRDIGAPLFAQAATPERSVADVAPLATPYALTATPDGVWLDGSFTFGGTAESVTLYVPAAGGPATTWCDPDALCTHPLGLDFTRQSHRSFAWSGQGVGTRVIAGLGTGNAPPYATLVADRFELRQSFAFPGAMRSAAFAAPDEGWVGPSHVTRAPEPHVLAPWPVPVRRPLTAITHAPGVAPGAVDGPGLAVGSDGTVLRYTPGQGWDAESLLGSSGVARPDLRGVAWPTEEFAYAVGDDGAMWRWRRATGLWESDPGAPFDFQGHLMGVAFQPGNPERGYAVGRRGVLLRYDKSWTQEELPEAVRTTGPLGGPRDLTSIAFAGSQALVAAWTSVLVNDGSGWRVDDGAQALIDAVDGGRIYTVAGLPDGGAVAAGNGFVIERDSAGGPWRFADQPLPGLTAFAAAAYRDGDRVRALLAVVTGEDAWPVRQEYELQPPDPGAPPPLPPAFSLPREGVLLRETAAGWRDEHRDREVSPTRDVPWRPDPVLAFDTGSAGTGWVAGGSTGWVAQARQPFAYKETATIERYVPGAPEPSPNLAADPPATPEGPVRLAIGGHAQCRQPCAGLEQLRLLPEQTLSRTIERASWFAGQAHGPGALLYTGGRVDPAATSRNPTPQADANRLAAMLGAAGSSLPVFGAVAPADAAGGAAGTFKTAFAGSNAPLGGGGAPARVTPVELGAAPVPGQARTHYAADLGTGAGTVRVAVIDNAGGSLAASDPHQNPPEPQTPWLGLVLEDAKAKGIPVVVMGSLSLNTADEEFVAGDATEIAQLLRDGGASAYVYDSPNAQRAGNIPAGAQDTIPTYGSGSLGYGRIGFGVPGMFLLEVDGRERNPTTNRAPARVRMIPVIDDLVLAAPDGRVLNRSQPALFQGLGRRPRGGDALDESGTPSEVDPYVTLPDEFCPQGCAGLVRAEVRFSSSDPDIADFVRRDPDSPNPRKPLLDPRTDKPIADASSGLLCAYNAGTTTVSIRAGGLAYSTTVTVRPGSVLRPCGTIPLNPSRFPQAPAPAPNTPPAPAPASQQQPPVEPGVDVPVPPPPVAQTVPAPTTPPPPARAAPPPPTPPPFITPLVAVPPAILPPPPASARPIPPSGTSPVGSSTTVVQPAAKVQKEREEEIAPEQQDAAARYDPDGHPNLIGGGILALVVCAALAGAAVRTRNGPRDRGRELALSYARSEPRRHWRNP